MGAREVSEEKLRTGNLHHDPTINPGLGSPRCPRCLSLLDPDSEKGEWSITSVLHDATAVVLAAANVESRIQDSQALAQLTLALALVGCLVQFMVSTQIPLLLMFSGASAAFGGYVLPKFTQLTVTSYYTASSASHYGISLLTRHIEETHISRTQQDRLI